MKTFFLLFVLALLAGCYGNREIKAEMINAQLVRIDTVYRNANQLQVLTWEDRFHIRYVTFDDISRRYIVGTNMMVLKTR